MDLQSFCVGSRRKVHSFPFLRSAVQPTEKMSKSFQFGVPVNGPTVEETCFKKMPDISCNAQFTFEELTKNQDCHPKKTCFDQFNKLSHFTFSRVVGGFVGSKSQGGSASREPHQVWDVIFRQLVDTACQATMNNNAQQYFSIGEAVSQSIFGQFNNRKNSTLDFTSFLFARPCEFFAPEKTNMTSSSHSNCQNSSGSATLGGNARKDQESADSRLRDFNLKKESVKETDSQHITSKQSYADVAKAFIAARSDSVHKSGRHLGNPVTPLSQKHTFSMHRNSRKGNEALNRKGSRLNGSCYSQPSNNNSSQNPHKRSTMHDKCEEHVPSKFARDKSSHMRHAKIENLNSSRMKTNEGKNSQPTMLSKGQEEKKRRFNKYRNSNAREKERKNIDLQLQEDAVFTCNVPEQYCQNWRCEHNRMPSVLSVRKEFGNRKAEFKPKYSKQQSRLHSPPPRTLGSECVKLNKLNENHPKEENDTPEIKMMSEQILCKNEKSIMCGSSNLPKSGDDESSLTSSPPVAPVVLPPRIRVTSECSVDSEDSVVFERDEQDLDESESDDGLDSDSESEYSSTVECDSDTEDCDEVDFCYIIPPEDINAKVSENAYTHDAISPTPDRLKEINARWRQENSCLPKVEKVPKKVHFPCSEKLAKVHPMIHWLFAYREARRGPWEEVGRDRCRFRSRIECAERDLSRVFDPEHRRKVWEERMCDVGST